MVGNWGYCIFLELATSQEVHYKVKISNKFFEREVSYMCIELINFFFRKTTWMVKINWGMRIDVRISPFIGICNTFCFSVKVILRCKSALGWYNNTMHNSFLWNGVTVAKAILKHAVQHSEKNFPRFTFNIFLLS